METKTQNTEKKNLKKLADAELTVTLFDKCDMIISTSGCTGCTYSGSTDQCAQYNVPDCIAKGTKISMADGFIKNVESIAEGDMVLTFNHETGCYVGSEVLYVYKGDTPKCAFTVRFANGAELSIVGEHDLFEQESRRYVTLTEENSEQFIGRHFYSVAERAYVELVGVTRETEAVEYYEIYAKNTLNCIANGMLNVADDVDHRLNIYEFDDNLKADAVALAEDIQKYGVFAYSAEYGYTMEEYAAWNMRYLKIAVSKGLITWERLRKVHSEYKNQLNHRVISECA